MSARWSSRTAVVVTCGALVALAGAVPASAHVRAEPETAPGGGYSVITFRVPTESDTAGTVRVEVTLPADRPVTSASTEPMPGWTAQVTKAPLPAPVSTGHGGTVTEAVRTVTWTAAPGTRIGPDQFAEFKLSAGPLPSTPGPLVMPTLQTYDDGSSVAWSEPPAPAGAPEPERPAPVLEITPAEDGERAGASGGDDATASAAGPEASDDSARWLGGVGLVLGALGAALGGIALVRSGRRG